MNKPWDWNLILGTSLMALSSALVVFALLNWRSHSQISKPYKTDILHQETPFDLKKMSGQDKFRLYSATLNFCVGHYEPNSCIHYLIVCGEPCKKLVSKKNFARVRADYWALMKERGLVAQRTPTNRK